jgi:Zn finger protein HypA/HybF involved in hydrogenase expression
VKSELGSPATLGSSAAAGVRLIVWCRDCSHQVEPDPTEQSDRYGAETTLIDWHARLSCSKCGSRQVDMVVTGARRRPYS